MLEVAVALKIKEKGTNLEEFNTLVEALRRTESPILEAISKVVEGKPIYTWEDCADDYDTEIEKEALLLYIKADNRFVFTDRETGCIYKAFFTGSFIVLVEENEVGSMSLEVVDLSV